MRRTLILILAAIGAILMAAIIFATVARVLTPEDTWIPAQGWSAFGGKNSTGQWVKHGNPSAPMPK